MKCVVPGSNIKILARAIHALAKIGDEMYVQPQQKSLSFRTVNMANSAYADFTFAETYFSYYIFGDLAEEDALKCKISLRSAMTVFKVPNAIDKQVETCHIKLEPDASVLIFTLKYRNSIKKTHLLPILDCEKLQAAYAKDGSPNQLSTQARVLLDAIQNFQQNLVEITMQITVNKVLLRNYIDDTNSIANKTRTQLVLGSGEFDRYVVNTETTITFCMKELRAILNFAEVTGLPINLHFENAGRPIVFVLKNTCFEANLVLSTLNPDADSQSDVSIPAKYGKPTKKRSTVRKKSNKVSPKSLSSISNRLSNTLQLPSQQTHNTKQLPTIKTEDKTSIAMDKKTNRRTSSSSSHVTGLSQEKNKHQNDSTVDERVAEDDHMEHVRSNKISDNSRKVVQSVFSNIIKRKCTDSKNEYEDNQDISPNGNAAVSAPQPAKIAKIIFKKCFEKTFDPRMLPGHDIVLVEDSDENSE